MKGCNVVYSKNLLNSVCGKNQNTNSQLKCSIVVVHYDDGVGPVASSHFCFFGAGSAEGSGGTKYV